MFGRNSIIILSSLMLALMVSCSAASRQGQTGSSLQIIEEAREYYEEGDISQAMDVLRRVPSNDELYADANILLGKLYLKITDYSNSLRYFKKAAGSDRDNAFAWYYIGYLNQKMNRNKSAYKYYKKAIFIDRDLLNPAYNPLIVKNMFKNRLYIYIYSLEEDHLFSPVDDAYLFYDERVIARIPDSN